MTIELEEFLKLPHEKKWQVFEAMEKFGGSFAKHLAASWFFADPLNQHIVETSFYHLIKEYTAEHFVSK